MPLEDRLLLSTFYVSASAADAGNGSSEAPFRDIQAAVNTAARGDTIKVATGTYTYSAEHDVALASFGTTAVVTVLNQKDLTLLGGYAPSDWSLADPDANPTIIDGQDQYRGLMVSDADGGSNNSLEMEGFIVRNGLARGIPSRSDADHQTFGLGGGMLVESSHLEIRDTVFEDNRAIGEDTTNSYGGAGAGGGLAIFYSPSTVVLEDIIFRRNEALGGRGTNRGGFGQGGGLFTDMANVDVSVNLIAENLLFEDNLAIGGDTDGAGYSPARIASDGIGAGMHIVHTTAEFTNVTAWHNQAIGGNAPNGVPGGGFGGATCVESSSVTYTDCVFRDNLALGGDRPNALDMEAAVAIGGGVNVTNANITLERTEVIGNEARGGSAPVRKGAAGGAGVSVSTFDEPTTAVIRNCVIADNVLAMGEGTSEQDGGGGAGVWLQGTDALIEHTTIANNVTVDGSLTGQAIVLLDYLAPYPTAVDVCNSIIAGHDADHANGNGRPAVFVLAGDNTIRFQQTLFAGNTLDTNVNFPASMHGTVEGLDDILSASSAEFASPGAPDYDYHITDASPAIDQAVGSTVSVDYEGKPRYDVPDLGAFEAESWVHLPLADDFGDATGSEPGDLWTVCAGSVQVQTEQLVVTSDTTSVATLARISELDVSIEADVTLPASGESEAGLVARYDGEGQEMYWAGLVQDASGLRAEIRRSTTQGQEQLSSYTLTGTASRLRFDVAGEILRLFVDGQLVARAVDDALWQAGALGLSGSQDARFDNFAADVAQLASASLPVSDSFDSADDLPINESWVGLFGDFRVKAGQVCAQGSTLNLATWDGLSEANVSVNAQVSLSSSGSSHAGLVARYQGPGDSNMYLGALVGNGTDATAQLWRNVDGEWSLLLSGPVAACSGQLRLDVFGSTLSLYFDNTSVGSVTDQGLPEGGSVGLRATVGTTFDDFEACANTLELPFADDFNQEDGIEPGAPWRRQLGAFHTVNEVLRADGDQLNLAVVEQAVETDVDLESYVLISEAPFAHAGLVARYSGNGDTNMYLGALVRASDVLTVEIWRNVNGDWLPLGSQVVESGRGVLRFQVIGSFLQLSLDGQALVSTTDSSISGPGSVGIRSTQSTLFDDFQAEADSVPQAPPSATAPLSGDTDDSATTDWVEFAGAFEVNGDQVTSLGPGASLATRAGSAMANGLVSAQVTLAAGNPSFAGLIARHDGTIESDMYYAALVQVDGQFSAQIWRRLSQTWLPLASAPISSGSGKLTFELEGSTLKLSLDDQLIVSATDSTIPDSGAMGIRGTAGAVFNTVTTNSDTDGSLWFMDRAFLGSRSPSGQNWRTGL